MIHSYNSLPDQDTRKVMPPLSLSKLYSIVTGKGHLTDKYHLVAQM